MKVSLTLFGGNNYTPSHMGKELLMTEGTLPESIFCEPEIIQAGYDFLDDDDSDYSSGLDFSDDDLFTDDEMFDLDDL